MVDRFASLLKAVCTAIVETPGALGSKERSAFLSGVPQDGELGAFATRVQENPASVGDEHVTRVVSAGFSEDAIFEVIVCAAMAAGLKRVRIGLEALEGKR